MFRPSDADAFERDGPIVLPNYYALPLPGVVSEQPPTRAGLRTELARQEGNELDCISVVKIPIYDQACMGYIFATSFSSAIEPEDMMAIATLAVGMLINIATTLSNVVNYDGSSTLSLIVFIVELVVVWSNAIFLAVVLGHTYYHKRFGCDAALDVFLLGNNITSFSVLKLVSQASPGDASRVLQRLYRNARDWRDHVSMLAVVLKLLASIAIATAAVVLKLPQVVFTVNPVAAWTSTQWLQLVGFILNLAKIDRSYETETVTLLAAAHEHYMIPGGPKDKGPDNLLPLYTRMLRAFGFEEQVTFEAFEAIFDLHFGVGNTANAQREKFFNFMTFLLQIDNDKLRKFLQMTRSQAPFYAQGRAAFNKAVLESDALAMDMALWRSDPQRSSTVDLESAYPSKFRTVFECVDPSYDLEKAVDPVLVDSSAGGTSLLFVQNGAGGDQKKGSGAGGVPTPRAVATPRTAGTPGFQESAKTPRATGTPRVTGTPRAAGTPRAV